MTRRITEPDRTPRRRNIGWWLYQPYKYLVFAPLLGVSTLLLGSVAVLLSFVASPRVVSRVCGVTWARINARATPLRIEVAGREHVHPGTSYVVACNHQSLFDVLVLYGWLGIDFRWVMKQELRRVPGLGAACYRMGHIFIERSAYRSALASIEAAKRQIVGGTSVLFFPEGTRSETGELGPFKRGAFRFAVDLGLPVLPVTIAGTRDILPPHSTDLKPGRARLTIHQPIPVDDVVGGDLSGLMKQVRTAITGPLADLQESS
jgi:1-acyl-sn-glycerol-3-phosphate acyltransferase